VHAAIQVAPGRDTVVIASTTTGNTENCQDAYSLLRLRRRITGLWSISLTSGMRS
jgi:hypothetical protein